jgi:hypothetical protein
VYAARCPNKKQKDILDLRKYAFLAITVQMGHDHKPCMKLYWAKDELSVLLSIPV